MTYEIGDVVELETNERYFIYNQKEYNGKNYALIVDIDNNDKIDIIEIVSDPNGDIFRLVTDKNLKAELGLLFDKDMTE